MRVLYYLVFSLICVSCSKTEDENTELVGVWVWEESSGGIDGKTITPESSGINQEVYITQDSLQLTVNGNLEFETRYRIENRESIIFNEIREMIIYEENNLKQIIELQGDILYLIGDCNDCMINKYTKD